MTSKTRYWASTAAIASVSALAVTLAGLVGFRAGHAESETLLLQMQGQKTTIDGLNAELERVRAERDRLAAEPRDKPPQANRPRHARDPAGY
jgi:Tfp pilus assembly protein PilN